MATFSTISGSNAKGRWANSRGRAWLLAAALTSAGIVAATPLPAGADAPAAQASTPVKERVRLADQWAGEVEGTDAFISVFTLNNRQAGAYLADGADIATLVLGTRRGTTIELRPNEGTEVDATVDGDTVSGTVTIDDVEHEFSAERSSGDGGWYRGLKNKGGETIAAGFIVLEDGSARGAIRRSDQVVATPEFDPDDLTLDVPGGGTIKVLPVAAFVKKHQSLDPSGTAGSALAEQVPSPYLEPPTQAERTFVTDDVDEDTWLAVVARGGEAFGYVCDGEGVWGTLTGRVDDAGLVELEGMGSDPFAFSGTLAGDTVTGTLSIDGKESDARLAAAAPGTTGLYRLEDGDHVSWWIQTAAGLKGAVQTGRRAKTFETADAQGFETNSAAGGAGGAP